MGNEAICFLNEKLNAPLPAPEIIVITESESERDTNSLNE